MTQKIIAQGAEAKIILMKDKIVKDRIKKSYRIPELDNKIRRQRTKSEAKLLTKASQIIPVPTPLTTSAGRAGASASDGNVIKMPHLKGKKLSKHLNKFPLTKQKQICKQIGQNISKLHDANIIHGDLTTSNMILSKEKVFFIDFGLGFISQKIEDKAVDLHLLKQALEAKHFQNWEILFKSVLTGYKFKDSSKILERLKAVEKRGRYKG